MEGFISFGIDPEFRNPRLFFCFVFFTCLKIVHVQFGVVTYYFCFDQIEQFIRALNLMNRSLPIEDRVNFTPPLPIKSFDPGCPSHSILDTIIPHGLRELIEYRCAQQGILCVPLVNRFHAGRSVFRVGNVLCYFEREVPILYCLLMISFFLSFSFRSEVNVIFIFVFLYRLYSFCPKGYGFL